MSNLKHNYSLYQPVFSSWDVHPGNIHHGTKLAVMMVLQEGHDRYDPAGGDEDLELVPGGELHLLHVLGHALGHVLPELGQVLPHHGVKLAHGGPLLQRRAVRRLGPRLLELHPRYL